MSYLREVDRGASFQPFAAFREHFGFVPDVFRAQTLLPTVIEGEASLLDAVLFKERALTRIQKECILLVLAAANGNTACVGIHYQMLRLLSVSEQRLDQIISDYRKANLSPVNAALVSFALRLGLDAASISHQDVGVLSKHGLTDDAALEAILTTALGNFLCTLSSGVGAAPDFPSRNVPPIEPVFSSDPNDSRGAPEPFLRAPERSADDFAPFGFFREQFGFVPGIFRAQTLRPDVLDAEAELIRAVLQCDGLLTRAQKEYILSGDPATVTGSDIAVVDFVEKLAKRPSTVERKDIDLLRHQRFTDEQILEAVMTTALAHFLSTLRYGLGAAADFPLRDFRRGENKKAHLLTPDKRHTDAGLSVDPDAEWVAKVRAGNLNAFEELMNRHSQRVYRTLVGLLGDVEEARDAMQDTFLKAFQHLGSFEGRSKFSTWLVSIASNTAIQRLRNRKPVQSLDESEFESEEGFRPRQVQAWTEDPEQLYSQTEMRSLIEGSIMKLPAKYRVVLMLRDMEQLSIDEAAAALNLGTAALKARLLRGRLMLREALAPHFLAPPSSLKGSAKGVTP